MDIVLALIIAYILGSIPTAYILARLLKGIDIREHGSGNVGATNVVRTIGKTPGIIVFILDFLKGTIAVTLIPYIMRKYVPEIVISASFLKVVLGFIVIAGHIYPVFLKFKGGKGVSTTAGVLAGLSPEILLICFAIWGIVFKIFRYVSLASLTAAVVLPILAAITGKKIEIIIFCAVACIIGVYSHRMNIKRLMQGIENKC